MTDCYVNDIWGWGRKRADLLTLAFLGTWLGYTNASTTIIFGRF